MTVLAGFSLTIIGRFSPLSLLDAFLEKGWTYDDSGKISYTSLGDTDFYDWSEHPSNQWEAVRQVIALKADKAEPVGITLMIAGTDVGADFLLQPDECSISVVLSVNRVVLTDGRRTDFEWYRDKILLPLESSGFVVADCSFSEVD